MIDKKKAINIVIEAMSESLVIDIELGVAEDEIVEFEDGFIIRYDSKEAIKNPYSNMRISGIYPVIVEKDSGSIWKPSFHGYPGELISWYYENK